MVNFELLLYEAEKENVVVTEKQFKSNAKGICKGNKIAINKMLKTDTEKCCILAEELGHCYLTVGDITDQKQINNIRQEKFARSWAYKKLVGITDLIEAYKNGIRNKSELAEYLNVTEIFLDEAIQYYKEKYGLYCVIDNYTVYFEPLGVLEMF